MGAEQSMTRGGVIRDGKELVRLTAATNGQMAKSFWYHTLKVHVRSVPSLFAPQKDAPNGSRY